MRDLDDPINLFRRAAAWPLIPEGFGTVRFCGPSSSLRQLTPLPSCAAARRRLRAARPSRGRRPLGVAQQRPCALEAAGCGRHEKVPVHPIVPTEPVALALWHLDGAVDALRGDVGLVVPVASGYQVRAGDVLHPGGPSLERQSSASWEIAQGAPTGERGAISRSTLPATETVVTSIATKRSIPLLVSPQPNRYYFSPKSLTILLAAFMGKTNRRLFPLRARNPCRAYHSASSLLLASSATNLPPITFEMSSVRLIAWLNSTVPTRTSLILQRLADGNPT